jgi:hypothetical protein
MISFISRTHARAALCALASLAHFPVESGAGRVDPLDPNAAVPALVYESSLARYRSHRAAQPIDWRAANDTVNRIGGWRAYAREAQQVEPAGGQAPQPQQAAQPQPQPQPQPQSQPQSQPKGSSPSEPATPGPRHGPGHMKLP